jgi:hypothetical protein
MAILILRNARNLAFSSEIFSNHSQKQIFEQLPHAKFKDLQVDEKYE